MEVSHYAGGCATALYTRKEEVTLPLVGLDSIMPQSHYRWYVPRLQVLLSGRTTYKDASYLLRFGVSITLQVVQFVVIGIWLKHHCPSTTM